jgi:hypothetical protein
VFDVTLTNTYILLSPGKYGYVIIEGAPNENKMAGKGQTTSERACS